jgi:hypothetical protein
MRIFTAPYSWLIDQALDEHMKPYETLSDGTIRIYPEQQADLERMFARAGIDIQSIRTEDDFAKAHAAAGDALFAILFAGAESGDPVSMKAIKHFADGDLSNFMATLARSTFRTVNTED